MKLSRLLSAATCSASICAHHMPGMLCRRTKVALTYRSSTMKCFSRTECDVLRVYITSRNSSWQTYVTMFWDMRVSRSMNILKMFFLFVQSSWTRKWSQGTLVRVKLDIEIGFYFRSEIEVLFDIRTCAFICMTQSNVVYLLVGCINYGSANKVRVSKGVRWGVRR